jgi:catechol 2,3-dioxygenase-like lactoylglutathione lyase family enzyme
MASAPPSVAPMITNISIVSVFVKDVDESKSFYVDVLGFVAKDDVTLGDGYRWCTVVHPEQPELQVHLTVPGPPHSPEMVQAIRRTQDEGGQGRAVPPEAREAALRDRGAVSRQLGQLAGPRGAFGVLRSRFQLISSNVVPITH